MKPKQQDIDYKFFECSRQDYGNCDCTDKCHDDKPEIEL